MITKTNAIGTADGMTTWAVSGRLRYLGTPLLAPDVIAEGDNSVFSMVAQVQGGIPPRRDPH
ncbi:MAG: hypothetical protein H0X18_09860 [Geodermatophilaceae bacterium]|nr:hypothetical protein [Geodermatophilaceae bacterium]